MMRIPENNPFQWLKRILPASLFGRALLILVLPMLLMQASAIYFFYAKHWHDVQEHLSLSLAGDVSFIVHEMEHASEKQKEQLRLFAHEYLHIEVRVEPNDPALGHFPSKTDDDTFMLFADHLRDAIDQPFLIRHSPVENRVQLRIKMSNYVLKLQFSIKRLDNITADLFVWWMLGSAVLVLVIATAFLRNQIRPIRKLAEAAENFGKGQENIDFRPQGASEVRQAGRSFIAMRERLKRMISARTEMLAAISHDLRTPLTRMRLELAMLPDHKYAQSLLIDVTDMEKMIHEYLDFARGGGGEQAVQVDTDTLLQEVVGKYRQNGRNVTLTSAPQTEITIFHNAMCRCLNNVIDNALRYGNQCVISAQKMPRYVEIQIDDDGPGIPQENRELALQPFKRLDASRNLDTGGTGLGLSIVQDIVLRHGGELWLEDSSIGGLRVRLRLPL
jgi:two-component system osmolarity sensor histidine kinase EnvZ